MAIINLRDYYPFYTSDCFMEVSEEVAESFTISFVLGPAFCTWKSGPPCFSAIVNALVITEYCASKTILRTA